MIVKNLSSEATDFTGNIWLIENNGEKTLIDTGTGDSWETVKQVEKIDKVVLTHSHYDHTDNLEKVAEKFSPDVYAYKPSNIKVEAEKLEEGDSLELSNIIFKVFHTPGHKDDSICLYSRKEKILFTGDLVFPDGKFGRTDLEEGDRDLLIKSIRKIEGLEVDSFYPGHGDIVKYAAEESIKKSLESAEKREPKYKN